MPNGQTHEVSVREQAFLDTIEHAKYDRKIVKGLNKFMEGRVSEDMLSFYGEHELAAIRQHKDTMRDIEARMPVKLTRHYFELAKRSRPLQTLVKASPKETFDLAGTPDPAGQMNYSPIEGLLHKYELALIYVASTCSAHCRFCYREELIAGKEIKRPDGRTAPKGLAQISEVVAYIRQHNRLVLSNGGAHPKSGRGELREVLLSGGDPMVLSNRKLGAWLGALAEAGIDSIRIGTKEIAFHPARFDQALFTMLDSFHAHYPDVHLRMMVHFNHPDEFLRKDADGDYKRGDQQSLSWVAQSAQAVRELRTRPWVSIDNQAPIIRGINDDVDALRILQRELRRRGVENHYFFCGRDIIGHKTFNVPIERAWQLLNESQKGLSGVEAHARLALSHFRGKVEIVSVIEDPVTSIDDADDGIVIFKLIRSPGDARDRSKVAIARRNPAAVWIDGYEDRVLFDGIGLFETTRQPLRHRSPIIQSVVNA